MLIIGARMRTPGDLRLERALELAGEVRDVGGRAAHVEADDAVESCPLRGAHDADDAARGAREDRVLALEPPRVGEAAVDCMNMRRTPASSAATWST